MAWDAMRATLVCQDLLKVFAQALPNVEWLGVGARGEDGIIYLRNTIGGRVRVVFSGGALQAYRDATDDRARQRDRLVSHMTQIAEEASDEAFIRQEHLGL